MNEKMRVRHIRSRRNILDLLSNFRESWIVNVEINLTREEFEAYKQNKFEWLFTKMESVT